MNAATINTPSQFAQDVLKVLEDPRGWKYPVRPIACDNEQTAREIAAAMDFYYGGHEMIQANDTAGKQQWVVGSRGYYHYIGA
jgi:hypothetical protein